MGIPVGKIFVTSFFVHVFIFFGVWCLDLSNWCLDLPAGSAGSLQSSVGCLELTLGCLDLPLGIWICLLGVRMCVLGVWICLLGLECSAGCDCFYVLIAAAAKTSSRLDHDLDIPFLIFVWPAKASNPLDLVRSILASVDATVWKSNL